MDSTGGLARGTRGLLNGRVYGCVFARFVNSGPNWLVVGREVQWSVDQSVCRMNGLAVGGG